MRPATSLCLLSLWLLSEGCRPIVLPDPNDPVHNAALNGEILLRNIQDAQQILDRRVANGELSPENRDALLRKQIDKYLAEVRWNEIPDHDAWRLGDALRISGDWTRALQMYERAVGVAKTNDRFVNDSLRLARAQAKLGRTEEAIETVRTTFRAPPRDKAPILMAVLYEVAPLAKGKGHDPQLARLIEQAIEQHMRTIVDPNTKPGEDFLRARPVHVRKAWLLAAQAYRDAGMEEDARRCLNSAAFLHETFGSF
jgi:tetratricopeptide (TPR) repeat protein